MQGHAAPPMPPAQPVHAGASPGVHPGVRPGAHPGAGPGDHLGAPIRRFEPVPTSVVLSRFFRRRWGAFLWLALGLGLNAMTGLGPLPVKYAGPGFAICLLVGFVALVLTLLFQSRAVVDVYQLGLRQHVDGTGVKELTWDQIATLRIRNVRFVDENGRRDATPDESSYVVRSADGKVKLDFTERLTDIHALGEILQRATQPMLHQRYLARLAAGEAVELGRGVMLWHAGLVRHSTVTPWHQLQQVEVRQGHLIASPLGVFPLAEIDNPHVAVPLVIGHWQQAMASMRR